MLRMMVMVVVAVVMMTVTTTITMILLLAMKITLRIVSVKLKRGPRKLTQHASYPTASYCTYPTLMARSASEMESSRNVGR